MAALGLSATACGTTEGSVNNQIDTAASSSSSGGSSSGGSSSGGSSSGGSSGGDTTCANPSPQMVDGVDTGYDLCDAGFLRRRAVVECPSDVPRMNQTCGPIEPEGGSSCSTDADCTAKANGYCTMGGFDPSCWCNYGCTVDADCGDGQICLCGDPVGQCVTASCTTDADCGDGLLCTSYVSNPGCGGTGFACQVPTDECAGSTDCADGAECSYDGTRHYCQQPNCVIGRPFLVQGVERTAAQAQRRDWCAEGITPSGEVSAELRDRLCEHWTWIGLMEHASVAAFARFAMQLMQLGVPPQLLIETQQAMADETEHARLCFALASHYGERPIGPGPLAIEGALETNGLEEILAMVIREGCIGETVAALEAREALEHVVDPTVHAVLERIAEDERRHSLLAWRTMRWALDHGARPEWVRREFQLARAERVGDAPATPERFSDAVLLAHGVVGDAMRDALRRDVFDEIITPCLDSMLFIASSDQARSSA